MKDPDTLYDCMREAIVASLPPGLSKSEREALVPIRTDEVAKVCARWFRYGEYLEVEIDTEAQTCVVVENER